MEHDSDKSSVDTNGIPNEGLWLGAIKQALPEKVESKIRSYFQKCFEENPQIRFHGNLPTDTAVSFFLYWLIEYEPEEYMGKKFNFDPQDPIIFSSFNWSKI